MRCPIIYLPVEFGSREFEGKALLATTLADRGYSVVLGQQWLLCANLSILPPGAILLKSFNKSNHQAMKEARQYGHRVVVLEEEMLGQITEQAIVSMCVDNLVFQLADLVIAHGEFEAEVLRSTAGGAFRVEVAGNARIDLLKPAYRSFFKGPIEAIQERFGDFVLVNTNFQICNSIWGGIDEVMRLQKEVGFLNTDDPQSMQTWRDYLAFEEANRTAIDAAVRMLARRRPTQRIVVRPHPGEDVERWNGAFANCKNVMVLREGSHVPWTLGCRVLLHSSCTTGFEAHVGGQTAFSLVPQPGYITDSLISNKVNQVFARPEEIVSAVEALLDGKPVQAGPANDGSIERYVWNAGDKNGAQRIAELLVEELPSPTAVNLPPLRGFVERDRRLREKFELSMGDCRDTLHRIANAAGIKTRFDILPMGESLFLVQPVAAAHIQVTTQTMSASSKLARDQILPAIDSAIRSRDMVRVYEIFQANFSDAHRLPQACFLVGAALFELGQYPYALQYFQQSAVVENAQNVNIMLMLARTHQKTGEIELAHRYAEQTYRLVPTDQRVFDLYKELSLQTGAKPPEHWLVIGCSHVRYFRYLQINQAKFFNWTVHLECMEAAGATAFGLGNARSQSGALKLTREAQARMKTADRVIVHYGEIDCRRAAWKAAVTEGRPIEETIGESASHLELYVKHEILPHNSNVLLLGAKPQIISDEDFYQNSLEDERTVFKPLAERERITRMFNNLLQRSASRLAVGYADIDHVLDDTAMRRSFFARAFWDSYTTDTHGNVDTFAGLYHERLKALVGARR